MKITLTGEAPQHLLRALLIHKGAPIIGQPTYGPLPIDHIRWSPQAYAGLRGLSGATADMFTEIAGVIQSARESTPW
jgi:hypothetical protein